MTRRLSQHFLIDRRIQERIVELAAIRPGDTVIEIGAGHGELTQHIVRQGAKVTAVEVDPLLASELRDRFPDVDVITGDVRKVPLPSCQKIISNVPYGITTDLIIRILSMEFDHAVLTLQKEYAERLTAHPGSKRYSRISVYVYCHAASEILARVPPAAFHPPPEVDSAVVGLTRRPFPFPVRDRTLYFEVVRHLFSHRRKMIRSILRQRFGLPDDIQIPYGEMRVEQISPEAIAEISDLVSTLRSDGDAG